MIPETILFITLRWLDALDILLVAFLLYLLYNLVKGTVAINIFAGILAVVLLWTIVDAAQMKLLSKILGEFIGVGVIALIVVFQQEIRRFLLFIGSRGFYRRNLLFKIFLPFVGKKESSTGLNIDPIIEACKKMSSTLTGAILVITRRSELKFYMNTGEFINADISPTMLETIFFKNNPLHDGAAIISEDKIKAARCVLPVTENTSFPVHLGMRHRAAVGVTEQSDAIAIIVSEQTGEISYAKEGEIFTQLTIDQLREHLLEDFS
ncbi:MAG: diadenylate cyclase CdaA [Flavobacteriales bacterium]|nr:diadenylate cyclase CdaA [Flavobacteriales bacterium]